MICRGPSQPLPFCDFVREDLLNVKVIVQSSKLIIVL